MPRAEDFIPALKMGHRIYPENIAGMLGLPHIGEVYYVDRTNGNDTTNSGTRQDDAFATVFQAESATTDGQHDVVVLAPESGSGRTTEASSITWDKRFTHLIGSAAPTSLNVRAGMNFSSTATTPSFTHSSNGCVIKDVTITQFNDVNVLYSLSGDRNYFQGVHFAGIGHATAGDDAAARSLSISAGEENRFVDCTFGLDTVTRSTTNASVEQTGTCPRNQYHGCLFVAFCDNAGVVHFKADTGNCYERFVLFNNCIFLNADTASSTTMTTVMDLSTTGNGTVFLKDCWSKGATDWANNFDAVFMNMAKADTDEGGLSVIGT